MEEVVVIHMAVRLHRHRLAIGKLVIHYGGNVTTIHRTFQTRTVVLQLFLATNVQPAPTAPTLN